MVMSQTEKLRQYCADQASRQGLVDIRFVLSDAPGATVEAVSAEAMAMFDAHAAGQSRPLVFGDSHHR